MAASVNRDSGGGGTDGEPVWEELLKRLNLQGSEKDEVRVGGENLEKLKEAANWMALARLHRDKLVSAMSLFKMLRPARSPARKVTWRSVEDNRVVIQAACLGDWTRIMEEGPWSFRDFGLCDGKYDGISQHEGIKLDKKAGSEELRQDQ
ncbi:hypothetical protein QYE76_032847 [Lolium multiflorum]|uniref:DUF4283 domain-containing protein n=1 Tax=Lolium multiflorum TaxID=4521 RepID=A0AAD8QWD1_LOLMU|nr:hypothetical protein QYE76_032847 [Lolium multiflorum]